MLKYLKKYWFYCLLAPLFMVGEVAMDLIQPDMMADIVDNGVLKNDMALIITVGVKMILTVIAGGFCGVLCGVFANVAAQGFGNDLRKDLFAKIMHLSFQQTDKISTGSLVTRLTNDVTQVQHTVMMMVRGFVRNTVILWRHRNALPPVSPVCTGSSLRSAFCGIYCSLLHETDISAFCRGAEKTGRHQPHHAGDRGRRPGGESICEGRVRTGPL